MYGGMKFNAGRLVGMKSETNFTIAFIGLADLKKRAIYLNDPMLYYAFMLMSQNLVEVSSRIDESGFEVTAPLKFSFAHKPFIFRKYEAEVDIVHHIQGNLVPKSDGVIVSLARRARDARYLVSADPLPSLLRQIVDIVRHSNRPTIFAIQHSPLPKIQSILDIPDTIPIITYDYSKPASIQELLISLISKIDQS